ncbi:unnamed protein product [Brassica napus]|uniref:(rape) hypothetical protein n=1 Tax=Brassica napus TaxID=3708 RepID=A0A816ISU2_BRANA|nr:unnamed protein product [Brassica napus]
MNCIDRMLDTAHLRPCAPILQSGVKPPFPYSLTFTNIYELSFSDTKLTHQSREREREREREGMMSLSSVMVLLMILLVQVSSTQYKVGDLDSWGILTDAKVYSKWPKSHSFKIGDSSVMFLYPPSEDSMIQVTASNFKSCNTKDPILYMNDGNSLLQPHPKRNLLLHQRTSWPLSKVPEAHCLRRPLLRRSRRLVSLLFFCRCRRSLLPKRIWIDPALSEIFVFIAAILHCRCFAGLRCRRRCSHVKMAIIDFFINFVLPKKQTVIGSFFFFYSEKTCL